MKSRNVVGLTLCHHAQGWNDVNIIFSHHLQVFIVYVGIVRHMDESSVAEAYQGLVIGQGSGMGNDPHVVIRRGVQHCPVDFRCQFYLCPATFVPDIHPDLGDSISASRQLSYGSDCLFRVGNGMYSPVIRIVREARVRATARGTHAWRLVITSAADIPSELFQFYPRGNLFAVAACGDNRADAIIGVAVQVVGQVFLSEKL